MLVSISQIKLCKQYIRASPTLAYKTASTLTRKKGIVIRIRYLVVYNL